MEYLKEFETDLKFFFSQKEGEPLAKPCWVFVSVSHKCNFNCQMCGVKNILMDRDLELSAIKGILDEVASWRSESVVLLTGGEPFLRQDIFQAIKHGVRQGIAMEAVTNGSLIDETLAKKIIASGLKNIAVSLDGAGAATHDFIRRVPGAFDKAVRALRLLTEEKKRAGGGPQISVWTTIMKENVRELSAMIPLARSLGVECLVYHPVVVCQDDMQNTIAAGHFWITEDRIKTLQEQIAAITAYQKENGLVAFLHDPALWVDYFRGTLTKDVWTCNPFVFVDIGPDGEVRSCGASFGNIREKDLAACLETPQAHRARERMGRCEKPCLQTCWARPEAGSLDAAIKKFLSGLEASPLDDKKKKDLLEQGIGLLDQWEERILQKK